MAISASEGAASGNVTAAATFMFGSWSGAALSRCPDAHAPETAGVGGAGSVRRSVGGIVVTPVDPDEKDDDGERESAKVEWIHDIFLY
ncbi:MAG: hypothetical protein AMXMBFR7_42880 [Planctomycetota bacterium]